MDVKSLLSYTTCNSPVGLVRGHCGFQKEFLACSVLVQKQQRMTSFASCVTFWIADDDRTFFGSARRAPVVHGAAHSPGATRRALGCRVQGAAGTAPVMPETASPYKHELTDDPLYEHEQSCWPQRHRASEVSLTAQARTAARRVQSTASRSLDRSDDGSTTTRRCRTLERAARTRSGGCRSCCVDCHRG